MKKLLFIYNARAGKGGIVNHLADAIDIFVKAGYDVTACPTQFQGDGLIQAMNRAADYDRIVCSGGDGTLDEVVTGVKMAGVEIPIGYIPAGSTNDFASSLGLPRQMKKSAEIAVSDKLFNCDLGRFNDKYFVYVAAFGAFTDVTYETDQKLKNKLGYVAYLLEALKDVPLQSYPLKITYDNQVIEGNFLVGMVTNSLSVGGIKGITGPGVDLSDGLFEVLLVKEPENILGYNLIPPALLDRKIKSEYVISFKCSELKVESSQKIAWTLDGEYGGYLTEACVSNLREAMTIAVK